MRRELHVRFCESGEVQSLSATRLIITGASFEVLANEVRPFVERFLAERGLKLSAEKTRITHIDKGFDFLGQHVRRYGRKLLITPARRNTHAFLTKFRGILRANATATTEAGRSA